MFLHITEAVETIEKPNQMQFCIKGLQAVSEKLVYQPLWPKVKRYCKKKKTFFVQLSILNSMINK